MVLVFLISILILILLVILISTFSTIRTKIDKLILSNDNEEKKLRYDYQIYLEFYFLNRVRLFHISIDKQRIEKWHLKQKIEKVDFKQLEKKVLSKEIRKKVFEKLHLNLTKLKLEMYIGTEDVIITSGIVTIISAILGIGLSKVVQQYNEQKYYYHITPIYQNRNVIKINLNCIIQVKVVHIISMIYVLLKRRRVEKHERTSNRRSYDYSYE